MAELLTAAWTLVIVKYFFAIGFVPATPYQKYGSIAHVFSLHLLLAEKKYCVCNLPHGVVLKI